MNAVQTDNSKRQSDEEIPTLTNAMQLVSLICAGINSLKLSRQKVLRWTNNVGLLREWVKLLSTDWVPPSTTVVMAEDKETQPVCHLTDTGYKARDYLNKDYLQSAYPWMKEFHNGHISEIIETQRLPDQEKQWTDKTLETTVFRCDIVGEVTWGVKLLREIFAFNGPDNLLIQAFPMRDVIWDIDQVLSLVANIIHDYDNDPLSLMLINGDAIFPVYTGSVYHDEWRCDIEKTLITVKFMTLGRRGNKHLGKDIWEFRVLYELKDLINYKSDHGDQLIHEGRSTVFFRNSPLPRIKPANIHYYSSAIYG